MAAAVADYRPEARSQEKIKKTGAGPEPLRLAENPDILCALAGRGGPGRSSPGSPPRPTTCSPNGRAKLAAKGCDLLVVNRVGKASRSAPPTTRRWCSRRMAAHAVPRGPKEVLAEVIWDLVAARLAGPAGWSPAVG